MFKRMSVFILICMSIAVFSACNNSSSDSVPPIAPEGTYDVTFFATSTFDGTIVIADNCTTAIEKKIANENSCNPLGKFQGEVVISNDNGKLKIISKLQMAGGTVENSPADKFQYTEYSSVAPAADRLSGSGIGLDSYNADANGALSATPTKFETSPFEFKLVDGVLTIEMTLKGKMVDLGAGPTPIDAKTTVVAKKRNNETAAPNKDYFKAFTANPEGTYKVTFFGTATSAVTISDNCTIAVDKGIPLEGTSCDELTKSEGLIVVSNENGKLKIISKLQMEGGVFINFSAPDKFQYTEYSAVTPAADMASGSGTGLDGFNLEVATGELATTSVNFPTSPFKFTLVGDELTIEMTLLGKVTLMGPVDAITTVVATKLNGETTQPNKTRFWDFTVTP